MANIDDDNAKPIGQDNSNVDNVESFGPVIRRKGSKLMNWHQFFSQFRKQLSKPTAELLAHVEKIGKYDY